MNIRAYKVIFPNGKVVFESKEADHSGCSGHGNIYDLAVDVERRVSNFSKQKNFFGKVSVDFSPFHDIECHSGLSPRFCVALSDEEKFEFWHHFTIAHRRGLQRKATK